VFDFRSWGTTTSENIGVTGPAADTWYILVHGYAAFSGVTLLATVSTSGPTPTVLQPGVPITGISGAQASLTYYKMTVTSGVPSLTFTTSGGTGDVDLYVKFGQQPTTSSYGYRSWTNTTAETVTIPTPTAGDWYITLHGYAAYSGVTLSGTYGLAPAPNRVLAASAQPNFYKAKE
jgi:hypothetical protein